MNEKDPREQSYILPENQNSNIYENNQNTSRTQTVKNIMLVLSMLLWGYLIFIGLRSGVAANTRRKMRDLYSFFHPIGDFLFETIFRGNILLARLFIAFALYPIYYYIDKHKKKKAAQEKLESLAKDKSSDCSDNENKTFDRTKVVKRVMEHMNEASRRKRFIRFSLSFIPYLYILWSGIFGFYFRYYIYGYDAMVFVAVLLSLVPVYPALLVLQVMFYVYYVKSGKFSEKQRRGTRRIVLTLISSMLVIGVFHVIVAFVENLSNEKEGREVVEKYLAREYGEYADDMKIVGYNNGAFSIETPLLESCFYVEADGDGTARDGCDGEGFLGFKETFQEEYNLTGVLSDYLQDTYMSMYDCDFEITLYDYDYIEFLKHGSSTAFLQSCEFEVSCVSLYDDKYDREKLLDVVEKLYEDFSPNLMGFRGKINYIRIYIDGEKAYAVGVAERNCRIEIDVTTCYDNRKPYEKMYCNFATGEVTVTPTDSEEFSILLVP